MLRGHDPANCRTLPAETGGIAHNLETGSARLRQHARYMVHKEPMSGPKRPADDKPRPGSLPGGVVLWAIFRGRCLDRCAAAMLDVQNASIGIAFSTPLPAMTSVKGAECSGKMRSR